MNYLNYSIIVAILAPITGTLPIFFLKNISDKLKDSIMGFSAGIMLSATCFSLINPSLEIITKNNPEPLMSYFYLSLSILAGALLLHFCNTLIPHEHFDKGQEGTTSVDLKRIWLFVFAIAIHNLPEGLAIGTGAASYETNVALPILVGIGLQDIPEGFVVAVSLLSVGYSVKESFKIALLTGVLEAIAALFGYYLTSISATLLPWSLSLAAGSMLYVISDEIIPESHKGNYSKLATLGLMIGFTFMMFLDNALK